LPQRSAGTSREYKKKKIVVRRLGPFVVLST
jgi:hypothetical protein